MATWLPAPCGRCGQTVHPTPARGWVVGHKQARSTHPHLTWEVSNWQPEHRACSDRTGQAAVIAKARAEGQRSVSSPQPPPGQSPPLPAHTHEAQREPLEVREGLGWAHHCQSAPEWLQPYLQVPENASPPLAITAVHPRSTGSYGAQAIEWIEEHLPDVTTLRWWQRLAIVRQLEHDEDGLLVWRNIIESGPRRIGKSVRLRGMALWRLAHADLIGEPQLLMMCGKDLSIAREIHRKAWRWAEARPGWDVRKGVGQEEVNAVDDLGEHRWLVRSLDGVYGFDVCSGAVDESWAVPPPVVEEGLEPALLERISSQLLLTSTAHRKATSLMRRRIGEALAADDEETLLLLWGARPQDDWSDPEVWRAASPHWSAERHRMVSSKYARALGGEVDPTADDPDPIAGWASQYLNLWLLRQPTLAPGDPLVSEADWDALATEVPFVKPDAAAIESWFSEGVSLALAWKAGTQVILSVTDHPDLAHAAEALRESGFTGTAKVGKSLMKDPALKGIRRKPGEGRTAACVQDLQRLLAEDVVRHDASGHLSEQVLAIRTTPGVDGPRVLSKGRADAVKVASWAIGRVRLSVSGNSRILLPSSVGTSGNRT